MNCSLRTGGWRGQVDSFPLAHGRRETTSHTGKLQNPCGLPMPPEVHLRK